MPKYIVSQPAITLCMESGSSRLPTTTSAPMSRNPCARPSSFRTIARTALPCFNSSSVTVRPTAPTRPAAPVTRMGFAMFFSSCAFTYSKVRFLLSGRELRPRVEIVLQFAEPLQLLRNAPAVSDQSLERSRLPGTYPCDAQLDYFRIDNPRTILDCTMVL